MAGRGSRLRPHTLTVPKPLIPIAGKPIVHRLVEDIAKVLNQPIEEIAFIIHKDFGIEVENSLMAIAKSLNSKGTVYYQDQPKGTGHAIMCAAPSLSGPCVIAYADTLFKADFNLDSSADSVIWVKQVENPEAYGVVQLNDNNEIEGLVEKSKELVSDLAVIGIYYFKEAEDLKKELTYVLENQIIHGGEYQINDGIKRMMATGKKFVPGKVNEWMDCGNKNVTVETNGRILKFLHEEKAELISDNIQLDNSNIIEPCYIGEGVKLVNSTIGPYVSIGDQCIINNSKVKNSLIQTNTNIKNANLDNAMIGNHVIYDGNYTNVSIGDYSVLE